MAPDVRLTLTLAPGERSATVLEGVLDGIGAGLELDPGVAENLEAAVLRAAGEALRSADGTLEVELTATGADVSVALRSRPCAAAPALGAHARSLCALASGTSSLRMGRTPDGRDELVLGFRRDDPAPRRSLAAV